MFLKNLYQSILEILQSFDFSDIKNAFSVIKDVAILTGGWVALFNYRNQSNQRRIDNGVRLVKEFKESISPSEIKLWKELVLNTYEGTGAEVGNFIYFDFQNQRQQYPIEILFSNEGSGVIIPDSALNFEEDTKDLPLGNLVRRIAEQLNLIGYEVLYGDIELRVIYYEIGQIMDIFFLWFSQVRREEYKNIIRINYIHFLKMYEKNRNYLRNLPTKVYFSAD
jgi:hypothetical protein